MFKNPSLEKNHFLLALIPWAAYISAYLIAEVFLGGTQGKGLEGAAVTTFTLGYIAAIILWFAIVIAVWVRKGGSYAGHVVAASFILWAFLILANFVYSLSTAI